MHLNNIYVATGNENENDINIEFDHDIREAQICGELIIVLLAIPFNESGLDNLYAVSQQGKIVWKVQGLEEVFPNQKNLPYEQIIIKEDKIIAIDFYGRRYFINPLNGKIEKRDIVK